MYNVCLDKYCVISVKKGYFFWAIVRECVGHIYKYESFISVEVRMCILMWRCNLYSL